MILNLAYGNGYLPVDFPDRQTTLVEPRHLPGLPDERGAVMTALEHPVGAPLRHRLKSTDRVAISFTDITRATPNERLIPWLLEYLIGVLPKENIVLLNAIGTHRPNSLKELARLLTPEVLSTYRVINHDPTNPSAHVQIGVTRDQTPVLINRHAVEADLRILTGFIEPHFFAGFSGGPKAIMPGLAYIETVMSNHGARNISDPNAAFGVTKGNPIWEEMRDIALSAGPSFLLNVALNERRQITGVFAGDMVLAHEQGIEFVRRSAMHGVEEPFDIVVTTNSGYPLDQNLYQAVKGMSAGARIIKPGGTLILAAECREGVPSNCPMDQLLRSVSKPAEILKLLASPGFRKPEQWQAQIQALIQCKAHVMIHSSLPDAVIRAAHLTPCPDIAAKVQQCVRELGPTARIAVLPQGPLTIPYVR